MSAIIYSPLSTEPTSPEAARQVGFATASAGRKRYPPLPWQMEDLVGTIWRNLYTGAPGTAICLEEVSCSGRPRLRPVMAVPACRGAWIEDLGLWWGPDYLIEHWIRVDHWPPSDQLPWFGVELRDYRWSIAHLEQQIAYIEAHWGGVSCPVENRNSLRREVQSHRREIMHIEQRLRLFAEQHHLMIPLELLNSGLPYALGPTQLTLL
jgi:hypothetical protein